MTCVATPTNIPGVLVLQPWSATIQEITSFSIPQFTTAERDNFVSPPNGMIIYNITAGVFQVRQAGAWASLFNLAPDGVAPATPTATAVRQAGGRIVEIAFTFSEPSDWSITELYRSETNDSATAALVTIGRTKQFHDQNVVYGTTYYYWAKVVDMGGEKSGFSPSANHSITVAQIVTADIADNAITSAKVLADAITTLKIAAGAVTNERIAALAVDAAKLATGAVTTAKIAASAVTATEIATDAVTTPKLVAGSVTTAKVASEAITAAEIAAGAVVAAKIAAGAVIAGKIAADAVTATEIAANAIIAAKIASGAVIAGKIAAGAITAVGAEIADAAILTAKIADLNVTNLKVAELTLGTTKVQADAITQLASLRNDATVGPWSQSTGEVTVDSLNVTTNGGEVLLWYQASVSTSGDDYIQVKYYRNTTVLATYTTVSYGYWRSGVVFELDAPTSGTYTYKVTAQVLDGGDTVDSGANGFKMRRFGILTRKK